jgi:transcriptional regulator with XRE-family HTH domain
MSESFGARLREERERRKIDLRSIAEDTKIGFALLEGLERDDVRKWPSGIFRKSFIRSYAERIGLEPDKTAREFLERFPDPLDIVPAAPAVVAPPPAPDRQPAGPAATHDEPYAVRAGRTLQHLRPSPLLARLWSFVPAVLRRTPHPSHPPHSSAPSDPPDPSHLPHSSQVSSLRPISIKFTIVATGSSFTKGTFLSDIPRRCAAAACDVGISFALALLLFAVLDRFWTPLGVSMALYFGFGIVILGNTPGVCLFAPAVGEGPSQLSATPAFLRPGCQDSQV